MKEGQFLLCDLSKDLGNVLKYMFNPMQEDY